MSISRYYPAFNLFNKYGSKGYIGENVTQLQHAAQCAMLAESYCKKENIKKPLKTELVTGCFLHDIGHLLTFEDKKYKLMGDYGVMNHENMGSNYLRTIGFTENVCQFVENHIMTKRYLITKNDSYYNNLSEASKKTFEYQGGKLTSTEITQFENNKLFEFHLKIREWDDLAKSTEKIMLETIANMNAPEYYYNLYIQDK